jgi:hypothetical protein
MGKREGHFNDNFSKAARRPNPLLHAFLRADEEQDEQHTHSLRRHETPQSRTLEKRFTREADRILEAENCCRNSQESGACACISQSSRERYCAA